MFFIALSMLGGWILSLFGFDFLLATGMMELFGIAITKAGYYSIFALLGMARSIAAFSRSGTSIKLPMGKGKNLEELTKELDKKVNK